MVLSAYIRAELAAPGYMAISEWLGRPDVVTAYKEISHVHGLFGTSLFFFTAAMLSFVSAERGSALGKIWGIAAILIGTLQFTMCLWETYIILFPDSGSSMPPGWEGHSEVRSLQAMIMSESYFRMTAMTLLLLSSASVICTTAPYRLGSLMLSMLTLGTFALYSVFYLQTTLEIGMSLFIVPEVVLLAILAVVLIDPSRPDEPYLTIGVGLTLISSLAFDLVSTLSDDSMLHSSYYFIANNHMAQHGLLVFAFFAAWWHWASHNDKQWLQWLHAALMGAMLTLTYLPMMTIGQQGGERLTPDSPASFPDLHFLSSLGAYGLIALILLGLLLPFLKRQP